MSAAYFYHLTRGPLEATLPVLLGKARDAGWRIVIRGTDPERMEWLDRRLWMGEGFLPHGLAGGEHDARQPILLTTGEDVPNGAVCLMAVDGATVAVEEVARMQRVCILFDGHDDAAVAQARDHWRTLTEAGCAAKYWSEESGRWAMQAESGGT